MGPSGNLYEDTNAFKLLYPFPTLAEAEESARCWRACGMRVIIVPVDEAGNVLESAKRMA